MHVNFPGHFRVQMVQRRQDGSVDFNLDWKRYKEGFGDAAGNFWIGELMDTYNVRYSNNKLIE